jgi:hypothetical protein
VYFFREDINVNKINITHKCRENDLEICAVEIETEASKAYTEPPQEVLIVSLKILMIL